MNDKEIIQKIQSTALINEAIRFLYVSYYDKLESFVIKNNGKKEDAEDIIQDTMVIFVKVVKNGKFKQESTISTFLNAIARNLWFEKLRKTKSELSRIEKWGSESQYQWYDMNQEIQKKEALGLVGQLFNNLGDTCKKLLSLFYFEELSMKEILPQTNYENEQVLRNKKAKCMKALLEKINSKPQWASTMRAALQKIRS